MDDLFKKFDTLEIEVYKNNRVLSPLIACIHDLFYEMDNRIKKLERINEVHKSNEKIDTDEKYIKLMKIQEWLTQLKDKKYFFITDNNGYFDYKYDDHERERVNLPCRAYGPVYSPYGDHYRVIYSDDDFTLHYASDIPLTYEQKENIKYSIQAMIKYDRFGGVLF